MAGWCVIFRNITNFVELRRGNYGQFQRVVEAMTVRALSENDIKECFNDMMTLEDMQPYIEGSHELGYRKGLSEGMEIGRKEGLKEGREEDRRSLLGALLKAGVSEDILASATGLSRAEIEKLAEDA